MKKLKFFMFMFLQLHFIIILRNVRIVVDNSITQHMGTYIPVLAKVKQTSLLNLKGGAQEEEAGGSELTGQSGL